MSRAPRILVVSPIPSHPPDQGNAARILVLATELMARGIVADFFYYGMEGLTARQRADMEAFWHTFHFMPSQPHPRPAFPRFWGLDDWCPDALCMAVRDLHATRRYDAVLVNYVWMSRVLDGLRDTYRILDTHDLFGDRHLVSLREKLEPRWFFTSLAEENRGFARADLVLGIQDHETECIRSRVETEVITVGHLMPPLFLTSFDGGKPIATFGYLGSGNPWNVRSVIALDTMLRDSPTVDWLLGGSLLKKAIRLYSEPYLLGFVAELRDFYGLIDCVVNPMLGGTGLKIKTVEALAFGKPVVGTVCAFQGLNMRHEAHKLNDAAECAEIMKKYKENHSYRDEIRTASRVLYFEYLAKVSNEVDILSQSVKVS